MAGIASQGCIVTRRAQPPTRDKHCAGLREVVHAHNIPRNHTHPLPQPAHVYLFLSVAEPGSQSTLGFVTGPRENTVLRECNGGTRASTLFVFLFSRAKTRKICICKAWLWLQRGQPVGRHQQFTPRTNGGRGPALSSRMLVSSPNEEYFFDPSLPLSCGAKHN